MAVADDTGPVALCAPILGGISLLWDLSTITQSFFFPPLPFISLFLNEWVLLDCELTGKKLLIGMTLAIDLAQPESGLPPPSDGGPDQSRRMN